MGGSPRRHILSRGQNYIAATALIFKCSKDIQADGLVCCSTRSQYQLWMWMKLSHSGYDFEEYMVIFSFYPGMIWTKLCLQTHHVVFYCHKPKAMDSSAPRMKPLKLKTRINFLPLEDDCSSYFLFIFLFWYLHIFMCVCLSVCLCACLYVYIHTHVYKHVCINFILILAVCPALVDLANRASQLVLWNPCLLCKPWD